MPLKGCIFNTHLLEKPEATATCKELPVITVNKGVDKKMNN
jgi:hypothetical protein